MEIKRGWEVDFKGGVAGKKKGTLRFEKRVPQGVCARNKRDEQSSRLKGKKAKKPATFLLDCDRSENEFYTKKDALYVKGYFISVTNAMWGRFTAALAAGKARDGARTERAIGVISAVKRGARTTEIGTERIEREKER